MEPGAPGASACAIRAGRFLFVGDESGARAALAGSARAEEIDLGGRCVLPGLTDSHLHFLWYTQSLHGVDAETPTLAEALARVRSRAAESAPGEWITGSGWNHNVWGTGALPDRRSLDEAAPAKPGDAGGKERSCALGQFAGAENGGDTSWIPLTPPGEDCARRGRNAFRDSPGKRHAARAGGRSPSIRPRPCAHDEKSPGGGPPTRAHGGPRLRQGPCLRGLPGNARRRRSVGASGQGHSPRDAFPRGFTGASKRLWR